MDIYAERSYMTPLSNSTLLPLLLLSLASQKNAPKTSTTFKEEYDYIVVGGGAAGSVISSRLSEIPCVKVLVIEAGHKPPLLTEVPGLAHYFYSSDIDWKFKTIPQRHAGYGRKNRKIPYISGKVLGGSSSFNGMFYIRGNRKNYDDWEEQGAKGWSYKDVFPYFLELEDNRNPLFLANGYHTFGGKITAEQPRYYSELKQAVFGAARSLGYEFVDSNAAKQTGFFDHQSNIRNNQSCTAVKGYLVPAEKRKNLDILINAMVTKVIVKGGRATGVEFNFEGQSFIVRAKREVILSGGAVNTPKLLMLSGIGPREELQMFGIPVLADLPVGKNFHEHATIKFPFTMNPRFRSIDEKLSDTANILQFINQRSGPLASTIGYLHTAFLDGLNIFSANDSPTLQLYFLENRKSFENPADLEPEVYRQYFRPYEDRPAFACSSTVLQVKSRGSVTLKSRNPFDPPLIDPNYFADPQELESIVKGLKICKKFLNMPQMRKLDAKPYENLLPGCEMFAWSEDKYLGCYARSLVTSSYHSVGSCKMGNQNDTSTVVDPELKVKNIQGLRVVDASVMPIVPWGNTHIPTVMIAEKASDVIKGTISCPFGVNFYGPVPCQ